MKLRSRIAWAGALSLFVASPAFADEASDLAAIKAQLGAIQREYGSKIRSLESRLAKAEAEARAARAAAASASATAGAAQASAAAATVTVDQSTAALQQALADAPPPAAAPPASNNAFNPGIAAVLNGFYVASSRDPNTAHIRGFAQGDEANGPVRGFFFGLSKSL